jgi:iron complex outermembrane receptor protein
MKTALAIQVAGIALCSALAARTGAAAEASAEQADRLDDTLLEEIVVTAQKREQSLLDVSASVSALGAAQLQNAGISGLQDLQIAVPNITIGTSFGFSNLFVRGLGLNSVFANVDPSVTMYEDGAIISQPAAQLFSFFDLERVEVLRGPQGTLFGRNATGGLVHVISRKPTRTFEAHGEVNFGEKVRARSPMSMATR